MSIQLWRAYPPMLKKGGSVGILGEPSLSLAVLAHGDNARLTCSENAVVNKKRWTVHVNWPRDFLRNVPAVYFFTLYETGSTSPEANSNYLNDTNPKVDAAATTPTASTTTTAKTTGGHPSATGQPANTGQSNIGGLDGALPQGAIAGIAVGATIGGVLVMGGHSLCGVEVDYERFDIIA